MDFSFTEEQKLMIETARKFARERLAPHAAEWDEAGAMPLDHVRELGELGYMGMTVPEEYGGIEAGTVAYVACVAEISKGCASTGVTMAVNNSLVNDLLVTWAHEDLKREVLPDLAAGTKLGCFALTEPNAGSDPGALRTVAERDGDDYIINGSKCFATNGGIADWIIVFALTDKEGRAKGISAFLVAADTPGFEVAKHENKMGIRASSTCELVFNNCRVPRERLIGPERKGLRIALTTLDGGRISIAAQAIGIAEAAFEAAVQYAQERCQFGKPLAALPTIQNMVADMAMEIEVARTMMFKAAWLKDTGQRHTKEAAIAKLYASEMAARVVHKALQIHGGYGYMKEYALERHYRDQRITEIFRDPAPGDRQPGAAQELSPVSRPWDREQEPAAAPEPPGDPASPAESPADSAPSAPSARASAPPGEDPTCGSGAASAPPPAAAREGEEASSPPASHPAARWPLAALVIGVGFLTFRIISPFLNVLIIAVLLGSLSAPFHRRILHLVRGRRSLAAFLSCTAIVLVVLIPLLLLSLALVDQGVRSFNAVSEWIKAGNLEKLLASPRARQVQAFAERYLEFIDLQSFDIQGTLLSASSRLGQLLLSKGTSIISNLTGMAVNMFILVFVLFYVLRDGGRMLAFVLHLSPLSSSDERRLIERIRMVSRSAVLGSLLTALAQGVAGGIGLALVGLPALFWGTMMAFTSLIPLVGTALIWVPAAGYLLLSGSWAKALFCAAWCIVLVGSIDNFLRPFLMGGQAGLSPFLLFLAILGGIHTFGLLGMIYGPLIFGLLAILLYIYEAHFSEYLEHQDQT
jgi:alkylation response protein AidB-like acyl-CoA dehydrogenase/predicted PurR-regulated permease PerM